MSENVLVANSQNGDTSIAARCDERVKFNTIIEEFSIELKENNWAPLAKALTLSEDLGAAPVMRDGQICGNGAVLCPDLRSILVSKSGRLARTKYDRSHFIRVVSFDVDSWCATYDNGGEKDAKPSSDTPLLWNALMIAPGLFGWKKQPQFALHGHSCSTSKEAQAWHIPCSPEETLFSTPADLAALMNLMRAYPYPENKVYVRVNHGFFLLAETAEEAMNLLRTKLTPSAQK